MMNGTDKFKWAVRVTLFLIVVFVSGNLRQKYLKKLDDPYYRLAIVLIVTSLAFYDAISAVLFLLILVVASQGLKRFQAMALVREGMIAGPPVGDTSLAGQIGADSNSEIQQPVQFISKKKNNHSGAKVSRGDDDTEDVNLYDDDDKTEDVTVSVGERNSFTSADQLKSAQTNLFGDSEASRQEVRGISDGFGVQGMTDDGPMGSNLTSELFLGTEGLALL